jgi:hypothetical protein
MAIPRQDKNTDPLPVAEDGDLAFSGIDMRAPPLVQPGFASSAKNMRLEDGVYWPRKGLFTPTWTRYASGDFPYRASYLRNDDAAWTAAYATTYGSCIFSDPNSSGDTWLVRVCGSALLFFRETEIGRIIDFGPGLTVSAPVVIFQNFNQLIITRGGTQSSLVWNGSFDALVLELVPSSIASGYAAVPPASYGLAWRERSVLLCDRDNLVLSRIADSTQYETTHGIFYVNRGAGDILRAAVPIGAYSLLVLKSQSLHVFSATLADLTDARLDVQAVEMRFDSPKTAVSADNKVWWLDRRGVRTAQVAQIEGDNKVRLDVDSTISDKIRPLVNRINWQYASLFSATVTTDRIYFAVALDTQTTPQTLLVWNRVFNSWESYDQWNVTFSAQSLVSGYEWLNEPRTFAISSTGYVACLNYGLGEDHVGWSDDAATTSPIIQEFTSRGYTTGTNDTKLFKLAKIQADTWNPGTLAVSAIYDGPEEDDALNGITRDRTKYFTAAADFTGTNVDGRFPEAKRQDYSVKLTGTIPASGYANWADGASYSIGSTVYRPTNGRNYTSLSNHTGSDGNVPDESPDIWAYVASVPNIGNDTWSSGASYIAGDSVYFRQVQYTCLVANTASYGNIPEEAPSVWTDNGLDSAVGVAGVFLRPSLAAYHSADASRNGVISAKELSYLTELFVSSYYHEDPTAFSGYAPGAGAITTYHTSDPNHTGSIQLSGLTRAIFIANNKEGGTAITGSYKIDSSVTGGFNRGPTTPDGIALETFQQTSDRRTINRESVWCQVSVSNTQGAFKIRSLAIEAQPGNRVNSTHS